MAVGRARVAANCATARKNVRRWPFFMRICRSGAVEVQTQV